MLDVVRRRGRRKAADRDRQRDPLGQAAISYAELGWPVCVGAHLAADSLTSGRACSCDRVGCPAPGAHPVSPTWQMQATVDTPTIARWWAARPEAPVILVTGRVFDVLDVPAPVGMAALTAIEAAGSGSGPVGEAGGRMLFFVTTRGAPVDEEEWWSCRLDCEPENVTGRGSLRWHCRDSYVLAPPSAAGPGTDGPGGVSRWVRDPADHPLPDALRLLEFLVDACGEAELS
ncbi:MAG TPA: bifunctional DNA primase/polymerase [Streptosporangiaceae bacterium]